MTEVEELANKYFDEECQHSYADNVIVLMFLFKTHESPTAWRYYCYTITFLEEK